MQESHPVDELSFYDQPGSDALFAAPSPSRQSFDSFTGQGSSRRLRRSSSTSSLQSQCSIASAVSTVSEAASTSSCSSVEQVFFGPLSEKEKKLVAKLGRQPKDTSSTPSREESRAVPTSSRRLRKKDSLDFNRRKTLGFSSRKSDDSGTSRRWEGGLIEKRNTPRMDTPLRAVVALGPASDCATISLTLGMSAGSSGESDAQAAEIIDPQTSPNQAYTETSAPYNQPSLARIPSSLSLADDFADMAVYDHVEMIIQQASGYQGLEAREENVNVKLGVTEQDDVEHALSAEVAIPAIEEHANDDSDKENSRTGSHNVSVRSSRSALGAVSTKSNRGHVLRELAVYGGSERKSLRDRKGERAERGNVRIDTVTLSSAPPTPASTAVSFPAQPSLEIHAEESGSSSSIFLAASNRLSDTDRQQSTPPPEATRDEITKASARLQEVLRLEDSGSQARESERLSTPKDGGNDDESFDPDSPLPMSRAPRHSLLLSLTASPIQAEEASPSKSSSESTSPLRDDLFMPEYQIITTPYRNRSMRSSPTALGIKTPVGPVVPRHRDSHTKRRAQATLERQAAISNKLSAVSLNMSGLGSSAYGSAGTPYKSISHPQEMLPSDTPASIARPEKPVVEGNIGVVGTTTPNLQLPTLAIVHDVFDEPTGSREQSRPKSPTRYSEETYKRGGVQQNTSETLASRIPKPVAPPTQPVFQKPMISNLPVLKPLVPTMKSSATQKLTSSITATFKAVRPEITSQNEPIKLGTPVRGRLPSAFAFRSPAASRVLSASNPSKFAQARTASGSLLSSTSGAARPITPAKGLYRSMGVREPGPPTPRRNDTLGAVIIHNTLNKPITPSSCTTDVISHSTTSDKPPVATAPQPLAATTTAQPLPIHPQGRSLESFGTSADLSDSIATAKPAPTTTRRMPSRVPTERETSESDAVPVAPLLLQGGRTPSAETRLTAGGRAMRPIRPIASLPASQRKQRSAPPPAPKPTAVHTGESSEKEMIAAKAKPAHINEFSKKEMETLTMLNTARNEVYFCMLDRNVVKKDGPKPPSPKVRTIAERKEEERKLGREARAKRRGGSVRGNSAGGDESSAQEDTTDKPPSLADLLPRLTHVRGAGEDEDYQTPARPLKRTRKSGPAAAGRVEDDPSPTGPKRKKNRTTTTTSTVLVLPEAAQEEKYVTWDKGLVVIERAELSVPRHHREGEPVDASLKSCLKRRDTASLFYLLLC
ncbi:hypothetical protein QFC19_008643 [Naganishia cerealis]|uniref:Uncharacterized protein n=1 Tax=Naganishia cerealis TaxID=610337 RepID=A0ACC2V0X4_9TREE|nr:hypothetical protein QFC19_008643 [Naganishia cerealis]